MTAGLAAISTDYLGQIERGRKTPSTKVTRAIASALGVQVGVLLGEVVTPAVAGSVSPPVSGDRLALALMSGGGTPVEIAELADRTETAWRIWHGSGHRYSDLLPSLPELIADTEATLRARRHDPRRRRLSVVASDLYGLVRTVTRRVGRSDLSFLVADRGLRSAEDADDPIQLAVARWNLGHVLLLSGEYEAAIELVTSAATTLLAETGPTAPALAMTGALELVAAVAEARSGRLWEARERLNTAQPLGAAAREAGGVGHTMFGPLNIGLHAIAIELQAGDALEALRIAEHLDTTDCPSVERRFTFALDLAHAYELRRQETGSLLHLLDAERVAPEDLRYNPTAQAMVARLIRNSRNGVHRTQALDMADRMGLSPDPV